MRKIYLFLLFVCFVLLFPLNSVEAKEEYIDIYDIEDLYDIRNNPSANYRLVKDIDMTEATSEGGEWDAGFGWTPIPEFSGKFNGNGHRIIGMHIYGKPNVKYLGLFGYVTGSISNLSMVNIDISGFTKNDLSYYIGGIAGALDEGSITSCAVQGHIDASNTGWRQTGGIVGKGAGAIITDCISDCNIVEKATYYGGGIAGDAWYCDVSHCYFIGNIDGYEYSGGNQGAIGGVHPQYVSECYYLKGSAKSGGLSEDSEGKVMSLTSSMMKKQNVFSGFDFSNTWFIDKDSSYKYPQLFSCPIVRIESFELVAEPTKIEYLKGEDLNLDGASAKIEYEDGKVVTIPIEKAMCSYSMKAGTQVVTVNYFGKKTSFEIIVKADDSIVVTKSAPELDIGDVFRFRVKYSGTEKLTFKSSNTDLLTIDKSTGRASAKKAGKVTITIKAGDQVVKLKVKVLK